MATKEEIKKSLASIIAKNKLEKITVLKASKKEKVTHVDYLATESKKIKILITELNEMHGVNYTPSGKFKVPDLSAKAVRVKVGRKSPTHLVSFRSFTKSSGRLPTDVQEHGSTFVLQRVLNNKANGGRGYTSAQQIIDDEDTYDGLRENVFYNYKDKLDEWIYTYYQQQKQFINPITGYASVKWSEFRYQNNSFVDMFDKYIMDDGLYNDFEENQKIKKYTEWNPADIYAARNVKTITQKLDKIFGKTNKKLEGGSLIELNGYLHTLLKEKKLVGISLKKIKDKAEAVLELRNTQMTEYKDPHVEDKNFTIDDISYEIDNIWKGGLVSTYVKFGTSFSMDVRSSSSKYANLDFATQISGKAAQGGNAPVEMVTKLLQSKGGSKSKFKNDNKQYPRTALEFVKPTPNMYKTSDYEKWFNVVSKYFKETGKPTKYDQFDVMIGKLYRLGMVSGGAPAAQTKLMTLHFFYESFTYYPKNKEYWLKLLYLGMKVGKIFAPHAKIY